MQDEIQPTKSIFVQILIFETLYLIRNLRIQTNSMGKLVKRQRASATKLYSISLGKTEEMIKKLKHQGADNCCDELNVIGRQTDKIIEYMSESLVHQQQNYSRSLILLDNMLVLDKQLLFQVHIPTGFIQNLNRYFNGIVCAIDDQMVIQRVQNTLYGCLYLVLLLIYRAGTSEQIKNKLLTKMFKNQFMNKLAQLPVNGCSVKLTRVISMILTYIVRNKPVACSNPNLKNLALSLILCCQQQITRAYLAVVLKKIINAITYAQILKYNILNFVFECLENQEGQTTKNALIIINQILKNFKPLTDKMIKMQLIKYWDLNIKKYPQLCLAIFKLILPFIPVDKKQNWFKIYLMHVLNNKQKISHTHLEILESLIQHISPTYYFQILEGSYIEKIDQPQLTSNKNLSLSIANFKCKFYSRLEELNYNLFIVYKNLQDQTLQISLSDLY